MRLPAPQLAEAHRLSASYILFVGTAFLLVLSFIMPAFRVSRVDVIGRGVSGSTVSRAAAVSGRNIFTIRGATVVARLERLPDVLVTGVELSLPSSVIVHASVRRPLVAWGQKGTLYLVDRYGRLISRVASTSLPVIWNFTPDRDYLGQYIKPVILLDARYAQEALPQGSIRRFTLGVRRGLMIVSKAGWRADLGLPYGSLLVTRIATLNAVLARSDRTGQRLRFVDLRSQAPYVSFF